MAVRQPASAVIRPPSAEPSPRLADQVTAPSVLATISSCPLVTLGIEEVRDGSKNAVRLTTTATTA